MSEQHKLWIEQFEAAEEIEEIHKDDIRQYIRGVLLVERSGECLLEDEA